MLTKGLGITGRISYGSVEETSALFGPNYPGDKGIGEISVELISLSKSE